MLVFAPAEAQLITDSKAKLQSSKVKKEKGFRLFKKKKKGKSSDPPGSGSASGTPKYSQGSIGSFFRNIKTPSPRSAAVLAGNQKSRKFEPRYSEGSPFKGKAFGAAPRYSRPVSYKGSKLGGAPRYSQPVSWKGANVAGIPRYSKPVNWKGTSFAGTPRYSKPVNWKGASFAGTPRYSKPVNWKGASFAGTPRYSKPVNWKGASFAGTPRYSKPVNWKGASFAGTPRYSKPVNWKGAYFPGTPRYSSFKHRFDVNRRYQEQTRPHDFWVAKYSGDVKFKRPHHKNMHPSVNYLMAKNISSKAIKKGLRKWNIFWVRLNPSMESPVGTRKVAKKPKFDKKEKDIWANGRDEKSTTRNDTSTAATEEPTTEEPEGGHP